MLIEDSREKMSPQWHLLKAKSCVYRGTCASKVLHVPLRLVEMRVSTKRWPEHPRLSKKKKDVSKFVKERRLKLNLWSQDQTNCIFWFYSKNQVETWYDSWKGIV